ncbi:hypothetical protein [Niallia sp. FSL W8-0635]|uniref:hypothetical protein n=1 Tax=Niallia sp. FSL W8-0635 TaxID=2975337 RepID=UPI0009C66063|nr:Uncharacterised protein [Mycobacteroides abscessus subsp. abscessus]HEO8422448.1 hypothetical protein [Yersinia enterocolitica]
MKLKKRILGYGIDLFLSIAICIVIAILTFIIAAVIALLFLPFVVSYEDTWNPILAATMKYTLLFGFLVFIATSLGANFKSPLTWGYKFTGLILENTSKFRFFTWWFLRSGIIGLFILAFAYHIANNFDYKYLFLPLSIYILYLLIDGIIFILTKGRRTFTDYWTDIKVLETSKVDKRIFPWSSPK